MSTSRRHSQALLRALVLLLALLAPGITPAHAQETPPVVTPYFDDSEGVFDDAQERTLVRDAELLQSSAIPTFVYVRIVGPEEAAPARALSFAETLRHDRAIETAPGADDGLVLVYSHVPDNGPASTIVASWGEHTFDHSGLTAGDIESILAKNPRTLLDQGHEFEALVYAMREIRYGGIYFPPQPEPLTGLRLILHDGLNFGAPLVAIVSVAALVFFSRRTRSNHVAATIAAGRATVLMIVLSIIGESRMGIACTIAIIATIALTTWLRTRRPATPRDDRIPWRRLLPDVVLALLFAAISLGMNLDALPDTPTHPDESRWLNRAYYARDLGDPFGPSWQDYVTTRGQPPLGSIVMGIGLAAQGKPLDSVKVWDFAYGSDWNIRMGAWPADDIRAAGRRTNAVIGALAVAAIYLLGRVLTNRVGGSIGALFLALHPLHIMLSTQALSDQTLALLLALIFLTGWWFAKRPTWSRAILLGVLLGLGGAVKLTPLLLAGPLAAFGLLRFVLDRSARDYAAKLLIQPLVAFAIFVAVYPFLWPSPIRRTWDLYAFRATEMEGQGAAWPDAAVASPLDALGRFGTYLGNTSTSRRLLGSLLDALGIHERPTGLDFLPAVAGLVLLLWWVAKRGFWTPEAMVALLMGAEAGTLIIGMRTDFYRYHLPIVVILAVCIAISTGSAWSALRPLLPSLRSRRTPGREPPTAPLADHLETTS